MTFYKIRPDINKKAIGTAFPQIQHVSGTIDADASDSLYKVIYSKFPNFNPNLDCLLLDEDAKLTDFLSASMISFGFIISEKVKDILVAHKLPEHIFYPAVIKHKNSHYKNYYWFYFVSDILNSIDYSKTAFVATDLLGYQTEDKCEINSPIDFIKKKENLSGEGDLQTSELYLKKTIIDKEDIFEIPFRNYEIIISERLFKQFQKNGITGLSAVVASKIKTSE